MLPRSSERRESHINDGGAGCAVLSELLKCHGGIQQYASGGIFEAMILRVDFGQICFSRRGWKMGAARGRGGTGAGGWRWLAVVQICCRFRLNQFCGMKAWMVAQARNAKRDMCAAASSTRPSMQGWRRGCLKRHGRYAAISSHVIRRGASRCQLRRGVRKAATFLSSSRGGNFAFLHFFIFIFRSGSKPTSARRSQKGGT